MSGNGGYHKSTQFGEFILEIKKGNHLPDDTVIPFGIIFISVGFDHLYVERPAYFTMRFLSEKGLLDVPEGVLSDLLPVPLGRFERRSLARLLDDRRPRVNGGLLYLLGIRSTADRFRFIKGALFPARRTGHGSLVTRPFRLAADVLRGL